MMFIQSAFILLLLPRCFSAESTNFAPVVATKSGKVRGLSKQYPDGLVLKYIGIPFAAPPVGPLRFQKPHPHAGWNGIFNATDFGPSCYQYLFQNDKWLIPNQNLSEDCLQLNIFVPRSINKTTPKTVMIWIHGGGFTGGQATLFDASYLALTGDVIVVTTNYRLGLFGFLSTEDSVAPGNYGLWDQHMAFTWVHDNIANFGGKPNSVCIFGESAGGYSVGLHTVSPLNRGLFHRAISESGAVVSPRALADRANDVAMKAGTLLNCSTTSSTELISCLISKPAQEILEIQSKATESTDELSFINKLGPVLDEHFILEDPNDILKHKNSPSYDMFKSVAVMAGTNNAEGGLMFFSLQRFQDRFKFNISQEIPASVLCKVVAPAVARDYFNGSEAVSQATCDEYTVPGPVDVQSRSILDVYAHLQFVIPTISTNMAHATANEEPTYHYLFSHQPSFSWIQDRPQWLIGANHAGELPFVFGLHAMYKPSTPKPAEELTLSKQMMVYWSNFAKTGDPNKPNTQVPLWPAFKFTRRSCMDLKVNPASRTNAFDEKYNFWTKTLPNITAPTYHHVENSVTTPSTPNGIVVTTVHNHAGTLLSYKIILVPILYITYHSIP